jgi:hypothetical protein
VDPTLVELLTAFGADADLIALAERFAAGTIPETEGDDVAAMVWPDGVEALDETELQSLADGLTALADDNAAGVALLNAAHEVVAEVETEVQVRETLAAAEEAELEAARARLRGDDPDGEVGDEDEVEETEANADGDDTDDSDGGEGEETDPAAAETEPEPVLAGAARRSQLAALARRSNAGPRNRVPATAAGETNRISFATGRAPALARGEDPTMADVDRAISDALSGLSGSGAIVGRENVRVASVHANFSDDRRLVDARGRFVGSDRMTELVDAALARGQRIANTQVAAGGFCAPAQPIYTVMTMGTTVRPIRDAALVNFQASRGRVVGMEPPRLQALAGSAGVWDEEMDIDALTDPEVVKNILRVTCGAEETGQVQAITSSLLYGNFLARSYGEWVAAWSSLARVAHAQLAEQELFDAIVAKATPVTTPTTELSATRDFVNYVARLAWHVRKRNRELRSMPFRLVTSDTVLDIVAEDIAVSAHGESNDENLTRAEQILTGALAARNINVTWSPDIDIPGPQGDATEAANYPTTVPYALYPEGWALHLDEGTEDFGVVRDATLIRQNDAMTFMETFEGVYRQGAKSDARTGSITLCPSGAVYGFADPDGKCASYT